MASCSDDESDSNNSDKRTGEFHRAFGKYDWCSCTKYVSMLREIECQCCKEMESVQKRWLMEQENKNALPATINFLLYVLTKTYYIQRW